MLLSDLTTTAQIPNGGFENWSAPNGHDVPGDWMTYNDFTAPYAVFTCAQGTPGYGSVSCLQLITQTIPGLTTLAGIAISGDPGASVDGFAYAQRPAQLNGWWMYQPAFPGPDFGLISVVLTKWNPLTESRDEIGTGFAITSGTISTWTAFSAAITYSSSDDPDTAVISMISSGSGLLQPGNIFSVDELEFGSSTGVSSAPLVDVFRLHPSQTAEFLTMETTSSVQEIMVFGMDGRRVDGIVHVPGGRVVDVRALACGHYVLRARLADGTTQVGRFLKR